MEKLIEGTKFKVKEIRNPLIKTAVGNIVEVVSSCEQSTEFKDLSTFDWFILDNENVNKCLEPLR